MPKPSKFPGLVSVRVPASTIKRLDVVAKRRKVDRAAVVRWWLDEIPADYMPEAKAKFRPMVRIPTGIEAFDKILGGGVVLGKVLLLGGLPGVGATTLLLQAASGFANEGRRALYASAEMSEANNRAYAGRISVESEDLFYYSDMNGLDVDVVFEKVMMIGAELLVIDSIQLCTTDGAAVGATKAILDSMSMIASFAEKKCVAVIVIGHYAKDGDFKVPAIQHKADGVARLVSRANYEQVDGTIKVVKDGMENLREIIMGKSRFCKDGTSALIEMTDAGYRPPSIVALRALRRCELV